MLKQNWLYTEHALVRFSIRPIKIWEYAKFLDSYRLYSNNFLHSVSPLHDSSLWWWRMVETTFEWMVKGGSATRHIRQRHRHSKPGETNFYITCYSAEVWQEGKNSCTEPTYARSRFHWLKNVKRNHKLWFFSFSFHFALPRLLTCALGKACWALIRRQTLSVMQGGTI